MVKHNFLDKYKFIEGFFRKNIIVAGDIMEDSGMADNTGCESTIKVGFYNSIYDNLELWNNFKQSFDVIIKNDGSLLFFNYLISQVLGKDSSEISEFNEDFLEKVGDLKIF